MSYRYELDWGFKNPRDSDSIRLSLNRKDYEDFCTWLRAKQEEARTKKLLASVIVDRDPGDEG